MSIGARLQGLRADITQAQQRYGRPPGAVKLVAVSKTHPVDTIRETLLAGQRDFGENRLQDAVPKIQALANEGLTWHFIGSIQANKTREIARAFDWVHSVDRLKVAQRLNEQRPDNKPPLNICMQVNISDEQGKSGVSLDALDELAASIIDLPRLRLRGLMAVPQPSLDFEQQRQSFSKLRRKLAQLNESGFKFDTLSMGMSADMVAAIAEGATIVRIGSAIFGPRS